MCHILNILRAYLDLRRRKWWEAGEIYIKKSFVIFTLLQILLA
jgi:hypothetical protein